MIRPKARALAATAAVLAIMQAAAAQADERLVEHAFTDNEVVRIDGKTGVQATIAFGRNEAIENVAVGDSQTWQITPNKRADLLFVKPLEASARTNMTVVTNRHTYFFDLVASPKARALYMLRFTYKDEPAEAVPGAVGAPAMAGLDPAEQALAAGDPAATPVDATALNFAWKRTGLAKLQPSRVYDDGISTYLLWPDNTAVPAILVKNEKGDEGPVNYAVRGQTIVIAEVPRQIILRSGKAVATLENARSEAAPGISAPPAAASGTAAVAQAAPAAAPTASTTIAASSNGN
ncbi:TrbG/VirB9 family P-type conjugative transfer protein [Novosphingobium sp. ST904]|uniref:TrbG/VirB9 family P-type conjugative transfer protein n=1 Tax=Novosphingobium sp. ST904 TaxID=1684385 RepID=UPI0006C8D785|nr:TrbG/VirB9 family P-type conjugative transfer protein [Novosphingobium sp. ST904]KPH59863.1 type VI secretion protein [Novosphingobium sp. ST904]TCM39830.1 type IV secretion system protein VirB9 [Novosphingobium sp. ST904]